MLVSPPTLLVEDIVVRFGGVVALDGVHVAANAGEVTGLIGPNGAGKTTLFNVVCGLQPATSGSVLIDGVDVSREPAHRRARHGLARTFQRLELFGSLTVADNLRVVAEARSGTGAPVDAAIEDGLRRVGIMDLADRPVGGLSTGTLRLVVVARALAAEPRLLLLDEPGAGLNDVETERLAELLHLLAGDGLAVVLVEHDVELVMDVCSVVHVLDFGRLLAVGPPDAIRQNPDVQAAYLGVAS
jgi:branched-chain amino acid transport system ATP-binding protein